MFENMTSRQMCGLQTSGAVTMKWCQIWRQWWKTHIRKYVACSSSNEKTSTDHHRMEGCHPLTFSRYSTNQRRLYIRLAFKSRFRCLKKDKTRRWCSVDIIIQESTEMKGWRIINKIDYCSRENAVVFCYIINPCGLFCFWRIQYDCMIVYWVLYIGLAVNLQPQHWKHIHRHQKYTIWYCQKVQ